MSSSQTNLNQNALFLFKKYRNAKLMQRKARKKAKEFDEWAAWFFKTIFTFLVEAVFLTLLTAAIYLSWVNGQDLKSCREDVRQLKEWVEKCDEEEKEAGDEITESTLITQEQSDES